MSTQWEGVAAQWGGYLEGKSMDLRKYIEERRKFLQIKDIMDLDFICTFCPSPPTR